MSRVQEHALPVEYVTVVTTLFGYGTMRYDADDGTPIEYGRVDYGSEGEALAEAQGWAAADDIPLDKHALRLTRAAISAKHTAQSSETLVGELMSDLRDAMQQASEPEPVEDRGSEGDANASPATDAAVTAVICSDRRTVDATFDASHWLAAASDEAIQSLALSDWTGEPADALAYFEEGRGEESVIAVLCWCGKSMDLPQDMHEGFTVTVDEDEAMAWLERHRPAVKAAIDALPRSTTVDARSASASGGLSP